MVDRLTLPLGQADRQQRKLSAPVRDVHRYAQAAPVGDGHGNDGVEADDASLRIELVTLRASAPQMPTQKRLEPLRDLIDMAREDACRDLRNDRGWPGR